MWLIPHCCKPESASCDNRTLHQMKANTQTIVQPRATDCNRWRNRMSCSLVSRPCIAAQIHRAANTPQKIGERSPTAIAIAKRSFNADTAHQSGIAGLGMYALKLYYDTEESREGVNALKDKRKPDFRKYAK